MKRTGIIRNKFKILEEVKNINQKKKNRFHHFLPDDQLRQKDDQSNEVLTTTSTVSITTIQSQTQFKCTKEYQQAKQKLKQINEIQKKIKGFTKNRLMAFKQSDIKILDGKITTLTNEAMANILQADKKLGIIRKTSSENTIQQRFIRNIQKSLACEIREVTKLLRTQQKQYFNRLKKYQLETKNDAIELTKQEKQKLKDEQAQEEIFEQLDKERDQQINELVNSINKLSTIYKELNQLVVDQGSLIDRIDYNIEQTLQHTQKAVVHLKSAEQHQNSPFADRIIKVLVVLILLFSIILGYKYASV